MENQIHQFRNALRQFEREIAYANDNCCDTGLTLGQCHLILDIERLNETSVQELSEEQNLDKSTISRTIDNLYKKGLINREVNPENRRQSKITLNETGISTCCSINNINDAFFEEVLRELSDKDIENFNSVFKKIADKMTKLRESKNKYC